MEAAFLRQLTLYPLKRSNIHAIGADIHLSVAPRLSKTAHMTVRLAYALSGDG